MMKLRKRPWPARLRNHYVEYRRLGIGRFKALYLGWCLAFGLGR